MLRPMSWEPELEELRRREELARRMGGDERVERQRASGRLTVRERDRAAVRRRAPSTRPVRSPAGAPTRTASWQASCRRTWSSGRAGSRAGAAIVQADDFTVRGGAADAAIWQKMVYAERLAASSGCRSCGWSTAPAAGEASSRWRRWASPTCRSSRAGRPRSRTCRRCPWSPRRWDRSPDSAPRAWSPRTSR